MRAGLIGLVYLLLHLMGLRDYTSIFSGTVAAAGTAHVLTSILGLVYAMSYLGAVILVPILVLASGFLVLFGLLAPGKIPEGTAPRASAE